ncbi:2-methylcitrate dehydratase PrpD [Cadophora sp. DSE1049]|nr:2-methylcitrate dehydratase PrpD [Cadophora sp. DSE1049]
MSFPSSNRPISSNQPMDPESHTGRLCLWINSLASCDIPDLIQTRAKYLILDGLGCAIIGAHLSWSEKATRAILNMEPEGDCPVFGWEKKISPLAAALLNSTFIQGIELDDYHSEAPLHSNSVVLPALFAAISSLSSKSQSQHFSGKQFLLAYITGLEVGPRVGNALRGIRMLTMGWHSGAVFGPSASAASVCKLLDMPAGRIEDALGIACTQACGLMSAQFESEVKRMHHGFAARNGLFAALLARDEYVGIKKVYDREYGGFLDMFSKGNGKEPRYKIEAITEGLGKTWKMENVKIKPYSAMAATHPGIDCIRLLQREYMKELLDLKDIESVRLEMADAGFHHGGFKVQRPITSTGAQMSAAYVAATQMVDGEVLPSGFRRDMLEREEVWGLVEKTECVLNEQYNGTMQTAAEIRLKCGKVLRAEVMSARGMNPELSNQEIVEKWRGITRGVVSDERRDMIEKLCLNLEKLEDVMELGDLLAGLTSNPIA